jgi:hypothetical protein
LVDCRIGGPREIRNDALVERYGCPLAISPSNH